MVETHEHHHTEAGDHGAKAHKAKHTPSQTGSEEAVSWSIDAADFRSRRIEVNIKTLSRNEMHKVIKMNEIIDR